MFSEMKTIVYTTILGGSDSLKQAPEGADECICVVDREHEDPKGWELVMHRTPVLPDPRREAWRIRCQPDWLFQGYDRVVWIDASFTLTNLESLLFDADPYPISALRHHKRSSIYEEGQEIIKVGQANKADVAQQLALYHAADFNPGHLSISCIIVRSHSEKVRAFNETWNREIQSNRGDNTQLSLDYSAWVNGLTIHALKGSRHDNPYATHDAADHKQRRKPYDK